MLEPGAILLQKPFTPAQLKAARTQNIGFLTEPITRRVGEGAAHWDLDARRFGAYANKRYTKIKNEEAYEHIFILH